MYGSRSGRCQRGSPSGHTNTPTKCLNSTYGTEHEMDHGPRARGQAEVLKKLPLTQAIIGTATPSKRQCKVNEINLSVRYFF